MWFRLELDEIYGFKLKKLKTKSLILSISSLSSKSLIIKKALKKFDFIEFF